MGWVRKPTIWGGVCASCGSRLEQLHEAWLDGAGTVRCLACGPDERDPVGGALVTTLPRAEVAARAPRRPRRAAAPELAAPEHPTDRALAHLLVEGGRVLSGRATPGGRPIGHVVVARSGVWAVESRDWSGRVEYRPTPTSHGRLRLVVGSVDRTTEAETVAALADELTELTGPAVPVEPALAITRGDWNLASLPSLVLNRPFQHGPVWVGPPRLVVTRINAPGPLEPAAVQRLSALLEERLGVR